MKPDTLSVKVNFFFLLVVYLKVALDWPNKCRSIFTGSEKQQNRK